jgi:hypothetical protein
MPQFVQVNPSSKFCLYSLLLILLVGISGCSPKAELVVGGLYSMNDGEGSFGVIKVIAIEEKGTHVRLYRNRWTDRPTTIDEATLTLAVNPSHIIYGAEHLALTRKGFYSLQPVFIKQGTVTPEEIQPYKIWTTSGANYIGEP